jgi:hypothetical protein
VPVIATAERSEDGVNGHVPTAHAVLVRPARHPAGEGNAKRCRSGTWQLRAVSPCRTASDGASTTSEVHVRDLNSSQARAVFLKRKIVVSIDKSCGRLMQRSCGHYFPNRCRTEDYCCGLPRVRRATCKSDHAHKRGLGRTRHTHHPCGSVAVGIKASGRQDLLGVYQITGAAGRPFLDKEFSALCMCR